MKRLLKVLLFTHMSTQTHAVRDNAKCCFGIPPPQRLRELLESEMDGTRKDPKPILLPCCYDGLSARLVARNGFEATFMTGFGK